MLPDPTLTAVRPEPVVTAVWPSLPLFTETLPPATFTAVAPVPAFALKLLYGEMSEIITTGQRAVPARAAELGYRHAHPDLGEALAAALHS